MSGYISSQTYLSSPPFELSDGYLEGISAFVNPLKTSGDYYDVVDWECSLAPYVDKIYWKIDAGSSLQYPNNVMWDRN